jgi:hypothetical protein
MKQLQLVMRNGMGCELQRFDVEVDEMGDVNLLALAREDSEVAVVLEMLSLGDSLVVEEAN